MADERAVEGSEQETASAETAETSQENTESGEKATGEVDYKAEYERLQAQHRKVNGALKETRDELKTAKNLIKKVGTTETAATEQQQETEAVDIEKKVREVTASTMTELEARRVSDDIDDTLDSLTSNEDEKKLIRAYYDDRLVKTGFSRKAILQDLKDAQLLANRGKYLADAEKKARKSLAEKSLMQNSSGLSMSSEQSADDTLAKLSADDRRFLKRMGWSDEKIKKQFGS